MFKLFGAFFLAVGAAGFSLCICRDLRRRLVLLKEVKYMYQLIQNEIRYSALPMPQIFENISDKIKAPLGDMLKSISRRMQHSQGGILSEIWQQEATLCLSDVPFTKRQKEGLLRFPECMGMIDGEGQAKALQHRIEELDGWITGQEKEADEKSRVIMSLGIGAGLLLIIVLL